MHTFWHHNFSLANITDFVKKEHDAYTRKRTMIPVLLDKSIQRIGQYVWRLEAGHFYMSIISMSQILESLETKYMKWEQRQTNRSIKTGFSLSHHMREASNVRDKISLKS